jgi:hypothetical protein
MTHSHRLALAFVFASVVGLAAQNVHLIGNLNTRDIGTQLLVGGKIAGLGEGDVTVVVNAQGVADVQCTNPGGNVAPGQDTAVSTSGSVTLPSPKNGNLNFSLSTATPVIPSSACPNAQWTATALDVEFSGGTFTVIQGGQVVLTQAF